MRKNTPAQADRAWRSYLALHGLPYEPPIRGRGIRGQALAWRAFLKRHGLSK